jgi:hypothetical protein
MLSEYAAIYLPSKDACGQWLSDRRALEKWLLEEMARELGGAIATELVEARGSYMTPAGVVVVEPITIVKSFCAAGPHRDWIHSLAGELKARARQQVVAIETSQGMEFV